ncbi:hypothetical protein [Geomicrobium sp. JCM 19038]|uniref:hypothetical protein n=1 Tax=Geomicrobium sp. JCM 19038 TaxID=1460635 RepID=UPI00045F15F0|nr:hypothetical protein [Geomicrobium sp. JCM 19038]GAK09010.1 hypothetical protein JCM19038_2820 [Geomicrobium sp. JCM 19038]
MTKPEDKNLKKSNGETAPQYYNEQSKQWSFSKGDQNGQNVHDQKLVSKLQELKSTIENQDDGSDEVVAGILGDIKNQLESIPETQQVNDSTKIDELTKLQSIIDVNNPVPSLSGIMNFIQGRWPVDYSEHPIKAIVVDPTDGDKDYGFVPQTEYDEHVGDESHLTDAQRQQIADVVNKANNEELKALSVMLNSYMERRDNPNQVTKTQVGLGSVDNVKQATKQEFDSHVGDVTHLTAEQRELIGNVNRKVSATDFYAHKNDNTHLTAEQRQKLEGDFSGGVTSYNDLTDVPNTFTPSAHDHGISQLSDFRINSQSGNLQFYDGVGWRNTDFINYDDNSGSPGARFLIAGTMDAGYFGIVPATELWTGRNWQRR